MVYLWRKTARGQCLSSLFYRKLEYVQTLVVLGSPYTKITNLLQLSSSQKGTKVHQERMPDPEDGEKQYTVGERKKTPNPSSKAHTPLMTQDNTSTPSIASLKSFKKGREDQTTGTSSFRAKMLSSTGREELSIHLRTAEYK